MPKAAIETSPAIRDPVASTAALLLYVSRSLVENPEEIDVVSRVLENTVTFQITAPDDTFGANPAQRARTLSSLRTIVKAAARKTGQIFQLELASDPID